MNRMAGFHHLAVSTGNIKAQIEFCTDVLGMQLVALHWMHGVPDTWHGFLRLNDESSIAFVQNPTIAGLGCEIGRTHAGNPGGTSAPGTMQHVALRVDRAEELLVMRDRLRSKGVPVLGPIDHGMCQSIYFAGPEHLALEISWSATPIDPDAWIDPEVAARAGIEPEELERYRNPPDPGHPEFPVPQPGADAPGPHMAGYPPGVYEGLLTIPDDRISDGIEHRSPAEIRAAGQDGP